MNIDWKSWTCICLLVVLQGAIAQTEIIESEWDFADDFEGEKNIDFWASGVNTKYGEPCETDPDASGNTLSFIYGPEPDHNPNWSEQRFTIPLEARQLQMSYDLFVPDNYIAPERNHKNFVLWSGEYGKVNANISVSSEDWGRDSGATPSIYIGADGNNYGHNMNSERPLFMENNDGEWHHIHVYLELSEGEGDYGRFEIFKDGRFITGTHHPQIESDDPPTEEQIHYATRGNYIDRGYLLGWSNGDFTEKTVFCIDNFSMKSNQTISQTTTAPMPPTELEITKNKTEE